VIAALALAAALGGAGVSTPVQQDDTVAGLVRTACADTGLRREALEATARRLRWRPVSMTSTRGAAGWVVGYRVGQATVLMSMTPADGVVDPEQASVCSVTVSRPSADWRSRIEALAADLELAAEPPFQGPPGVDMLSWSKLGVLTLSAAYAPSNQSLAVSLSRQFVTSTTQTVPSGN
jgi:hypothetical protein